MAVFAFNIENVKPENGDDSRALNSLAHSHTNTPTISLCGLCACIAVFAFNIENVKPENGDDSTNLSSLARVHTKHTNTSTYHFAAFAHALRSLRLILRM